MCGLIGIINNESNFQQKKKLGNLFSQLMWVGALRGFDSTGVALCKTEDKKLVDVASYKRALCSTDFLATKGYERLLRDFGEYKYIIGHNRAATKGSVIDMYSHPFEFNNLIGVHNGTLYNHNSLNKETFTSDSEALYHAMNEGDAVKVLEKADGAYALIWYDKNDSKLYLARNKERPLYLTTTKDKSVSVLASEYQMAEWILNRNGYPVEKSWEIPVGKIMYINDDDPDTLNEVATFKPYEKPNFPMTNYTGNSYGGYTSKRTKFRHRYKTNHKVYVQVTNVEIIGRSKRVEGYVLDDLFIPVCRVWLTESHPAYETIAPGMVFTSICNSSLYTEGSLKLEIYVNSSDTTVIPDYYTDDEPVLTDEEHEVYEDVVLGPNNKLLSKEEWEKASPCCCVCSSPIPWDDAEEVIYLHNDEPMCQGCVTSHHDWMM